MVREELTLVIISLATLDHELATMARLQLSSFFVAAGG
jgi:hypothetical protein